MRMHEAAAEVLRAEREPMDAKSIYRKIIEKQLFTFGAKDPIAVLNQTLRKKSQGENAMFRKVEPNKYTLNA